MTDYIAALYSKSHHPYAREATRLAQAVVDSAHSYVIDGVIRWRSNDRVPPADVVLLAAHVGEGVDVEACTRARTRENAAAIAAYRAANNKPMSPEELAEARAAHGPGVKLVNAITGRVTVT